MHEGIVYDAHICPVAVRIDNEEGLSVEVAYSEDSGNEFSNESTWDGPFGGVRVKKVDEEGNALEDAVFLIEGTRNDGADVGPYRIASDESGIACIVDALPAGSYRIVEAEAPEGYTVDATWGQSFLVQANGDMADFTQEESDWCVNTPGRPLAMPITGGPGTALLIAVAFFAIFAGLLLRRKGSASPVALYGTWTKGDLR